MDDIRTLTIRWADGSQVKSVTHAVPGDALQTHADVTLRICDAEIEHHIFIPRRVLIGMLRALEGSNNG
jgi:hypothetical protein